MGWLDTALDEEPPQGRNFPALIRRLYYAAVPVKQPSRRDEQRCVAREDGKPWIHPARLGGTGRFWQAPS